MATTPDAYSAHQALTVGRRAKAVPTDFAIAPLPGRTGDCLGVLRGTGAEAHGGHMASLALYGRLLATGSPDGRLRGWDLASGALAWESSEQHANRINDVAVTADGCLLATVSHDHTLRIWSASSGRLFFHRKHGHSAIHQIRWAVDSRRLAASTDDAVRIWDALTGRGLLRCRGHLEAVWSVSWSPDGRLLASGSADRTIRIWDAGNGNCLRCWRAHDDWVVGVAWSADGRLLASLGNDRRICLWDTQTGQSLGAWSAHPEADFLRYLTWSPDSRLLASAARDNSIRLWQVADGRELERFTFPEDYAWRLAWSADGRFLVSSHKGDVFRIWDTQRFMAAAAVAATTATLPTELAPLPQALTQLHRLQLYPPLALLRDLLALTGGRTPVGALAVLSRHPGVQALAALRWPVAARVGLVALLLQDFPLAEDWRPPPELTQAALQEKLTQALAGENVPAQAPPAPLAALRQQAGQIDDRLLSLLTLLGAEAVAADPGLPLTLRQRTPALPVLSATQRRLLGLRLRRATGGQAQGSGAGLERAGIDVQGDLRTLLPSQLVLPPPVLRSRDLRGELLYRARSGQAPPQLRPVVLLLDISPACFGPVESVLRLAAYWLARALLQAHTPALLVTAGGASQVRELTRPSDLVELWTLRSLAPAEPLKALQLARNLREALRADGPEPIIVAFSHPWFGAEDAAPAMTGLRGLFVQPRRSAPVRPALAGRCEYWESIEPGEGTTLADCLGRLLK